MILAMSSETANRFWQGKVSVPLAVGRGTIKITGAPPKLIALLPTAEPIQQGDVETLRAEGSDDLIV